MILALSAISAKAIPIDERTAASTLDLENILRIVEDKKGTLEPFSAEIEQLFAEAAPHSTAIGYTESTWWAQVSLENPFATEETRFLELKDSGEGMPEIIFFLKSSNGTMRKIVSGGLYRHTKDTVENGFIVVPITFQPQEKITVQVRIKGDAVNIPMHLRSQKTFLLEHYHEMLWKGLSYGVIVLLLLYNLILFFATKDKSYLYYVGFVFFLGLSLAGFDGLSAQYFLRNHPFWNLRLINIGCSLASAFLILFTHHFLRIRFHRPRLSKVLRALALACFVVALGNAVSKINLATNLAASSTAILCFASAASMFSKQKRLTIAFTIPLFFFIAGTLFTTARLATLLPMNFWTLNSLRIGMILNALFWSTALSYRIRLILKEQFSSDALLLQKAKDNEISKQKSLSNRIRLIQTISEKLNTPLDTLLSELKTIQQHSSTISCAALPPGTTPSSLELFWVEWQRQQGILAVSTDRLTSLSETLNEFKRQQEMLMKKGGHV
jgi:diguanylate cyclase